MVLTSLEIQYFYALLVPCYSLRSCVNGFTQLLTSFIQCRDVELTEKLDYSSGVALLGVSLILTIFRAFNVRDEAARVMVSAPLIAFTATHILYLNFYKLDLGNTFSRKLEKG